MLQEEFFFQGEDDRIFVNGQQETFVEGILSDEIDIAFIRLFNIPVNPNILDDGIQIGSFVDGPFSPALNGKEVMIYSKRLRQGKAAVVNNNSAIFFTGFADLLLVDVIQISPKITEKGDSGGVVLIENDILLGIIVGADQKYSYAIPFFKVNNFKPLTIA